MTPSFLAPATWRRCAVFSFVLCLCASPTLADQPDAEAHFIVRDEVVMPDPGPFSATVMRMGNGTEFLGHGTSFEPSIVRNWIKVTEGAANVVLAKPSDISNWNIYVNGTLDGAEVDVLRLIDGEFKIVRQDYVPEGGFHSSGWRNAFHGVRVVPPTETSRFFIWDHWNRPNVPYYFEVRAIDEYGKASGPSQTVELYSPESLTSLWNMEKPEQIPLIERTTSSSDTLGVIFGGIDAPQNFRGRVLAEGYAVLEWDPVEGATGYEIMVADTPPEEHTGYKIELAGGPDKEPLRKGDIVALRKKFWEFSRNEHVAHRVWNDGGTRTAYYPSFLEFHNGDGPGRQWRYVKHPPDTPVEEPGETYVEVELDRGIVWGMQAPLYSGMQAREARNILIPGETYILELWAKANRPFRLQVRMNGYYAEVEKVRPFVFNLTPKWRKFRVKFTPRRGFSRPGLGMLQTAPQGPVVIGLDNIRFYRADTEFMELLPEDSARLEQASLAALRFHSQVRTMRVTYDLEQLTHPPGVASRLPGRNTLPQSLEMARSVGVQPWLQIEPHLTPEEWLGLVEYLAAPFDPAVDDPAEKPWAAKRAAQGQLTPWTEEFDQIYFELGNETWNTIFAPWIFTTTFDHGEARPVNAGPTYGMFHNYVAQIMRQSPYWTPEMEEQFVEVIGGWEISPLFGARAAEHAPTADLVTTGAYQMGWETTGKALGEAPSDFYALLTHSLQFGGPRAKRHLAARDDVEAKTGRRYELGTYEAGPGYHLRGLNNSQITPEEADAQERSMKSVAGGTSTLDAFLMRAVLGYRTQTFFAYEPGRRWTSHALWQHGGHDFPPWMMLSLFNRIGTGDFLDVDAAKVPRHDIPEAGRTPGVEAAPMIGTYATRDGDRVTLFVLSRLLPDYPEEGHNGRTRVTVDLPFETASSVREIEMTGDYTTHNVKEEAVKLIETELPPLTGSRFLVPDLPPGHTRVFVFEGVGG